MSSAVTTTAAASSSSSPLSSKACYNSDCKDLRSDRSRKGWRLRTGDFAELCDRCAYVNLSTFNSVCFLISVFAVLEVCFARFVPSTLVVQARFLVRMFLHWGSSRGFSFEFCSFELTVLSVWGLGYETR